MFPVTLSLDAVYEGSQKTYAPTKKIVNIIKVQAWKRMTGFRI